MAKRQRYGPHRGPGSWMPRGAIAGSMCFTGRNAKKMALAERKKDQRVYGRRVKVVRRRLANMDTGRMETVYCSVPVGTTHDMWTRY